MTVVAMPTDLDLTRFEALSFDCYGTLIDWETGIAAVLAPWAREHGLGLTDEELLLAYADNEAAVERDTPTARYPAVLAAAFRRTGETLGAPVTIAGRSGWATRSRTGRRSPTRPTRSPGWPATTGSSSSPTCTGTGSPAATGGSAATSPRSSPPRTSAPTSRPRTTSARSTPRSRSSASRAIASCTSPRACSTTTCRPGAKACRRSGSTAATTAPAGARPRAPTEAWAYDLEFPSMAAFADAVDAAFGAPAGRRGDPGATPSPPDA